MPPPAGCRSSPFTVHAFAAPHRRSSLTELGLANNELTAPEPMVEEDEELPPQVEKLDESVISNDKPGLDLSVFDIED